MIDKLDDVYFQEPTYTILAELRQKVRDKGRRITYDCLSAIVKGTKVACSKGYILPGTHGAKLGLLVVLRGWASKQCKDCTDYDCEDTLKE